MPNRSIFIVHEIQPNDETALEELDLEGLLDKLNSAKSDFKNGENELEGFFDIDKGTTSNDLFFIFGHYIKYKSKNIPRVNPEARVIFKEPPIPGIVQEDIKFVIFKFDNKMYLTHKSSNKSTLSEFQVHFEEACDLKLSKIRLKTMFDQIRELSDIYDIKANFKSQAKIDVDNIIG